MNQRRMPQAEATAPMLALGLGEGGITPEEEAALDDAGIPWRPEDRAAGCTAQGAEPR